ncbi:MAG TPA: MraY family glycosyltransferase [Rhizomicrobium sp.]|nr:MraY family glycosyltransferase [Rhizomicrobium sp.]
MTLGINWLEASSMAAALLVALAILINGWAIGTRLKVVDHPDNIRKNHAQATPLVGGIAIMVPLLVWALAADVWPQLVAHGTIRLAIILCGGGAALLGFLDDRSSLSPSLRLALLMGLTLAALMISPQLLPAKFYWGHVAPSRVEPWLSYLLVAIGMAGYVNAVNMADGQDGGVAGMFAIWACCILMSGGGSADDLAALIFVTSLAVWVFNLRGKVFLGGTGAYGVTFVFGLLVLDVHNARTVSAETIIVWFFLPIVDCLRLLVMRPLQGRSPFEADRNHFHHRLNERFGKTAGLTIYLVLVGSTSVVAALAPRFAPACLTALAFAYVVLLLATEEETRRRVAPVKITTRD